MTPPPIETSTPQERRKWIRKEFPCYALGGKTETGTIREAFFANQVGAYNTLQYPQKGVFLRVASIFSK